MSGTVYVTWVVAVSSRDDPRAPLWNDVVPCIVEEGESLADAVLRELRAQGVDIQDGDTLIFPAAASGHRFLEVRQEHVYRKAR